MWMLLLGELRRRWLEYVLGAVAIALVVAALVSQRAVTASAEAEVHALSHKLGRNMLVLPAGTDLGAFHAQRYGAEALPDSAPRTLLESPLAGDISMVQARIYGNVDVGGVPVVLVGEDARWPSMGDVVPAVLGPEAARALGAGRGAMLQIGSSAVRVLDVQVPAPDGLDGAVFLPLAAAQRILGRPGEISALHLGGCWCKKDPTVLAGDVENLLPGSRAITVAGMLKAQQGSVDTMRRYSSALHAVGVLVVGLVVAALVGSQARRRVRELGLLVAIGAPPRAITWLFTGQAALAGALGGLLGWLAAGPITRILGEQILGATLTPPAGLLVPSVLLAALVSAVAAAIPAWRAASLDPTVVLRES